MAERRIMMFENYCDDMSWGDKIGCVCDLPIGHEGLHQCPDMECGEEWETKPEGEPFLPQSLSEKLNGG